MIHFVVVVGSPPAVDRQQPRLGPAIDRTCLLEGDVIQHRAPSGTWALAYRDYGDSVTGSRVAVDGDALAVVNGPALATSGDQQRLADEMLGWFRHGGARKVATSLGGSYNVVAIDPSLGARAFVDFSAMTPLYWFQADDFAVFSNRSTTAQEVAGTQGWDTRALSWLIGHSNLFGDEMPASSVRYLPPGTEARVDWGGAAVSLERSETWVWPTEGNGAGRDNLTSEEWDEITEELIANCRAVGTFEQRILLHLSGGKDSRLCLALSKAAGLGDRLSTVTNGPAVSPEVACATEVARVAGVEHNHLTPEIERGGGKQAAARLAPGPASPLPADARKAPTANVATGSRAGGTSAIVAPTLTAPARGGLTRDFEAVWTRVRQATYRYESIVDPWDGANTPITHRILSIKGFGGELYRGPGGHAKRFKTNRPETVDDMADMFVDYHQQMDPLGVLRPDVAAFQEEWLRKWVHDTAAEVRLDVLPEKFYVDYRLGHWNGPLAQGKPTHVVINPLLSAAAVRKIFELSIDARSTERLHYEVMLRAAPELLQVPFIGDRWSDTILAESSLDLPREQFAPARPGSAAPPPAPAPASRAPASSAASTARLARAAKQKLPKPGFLRATPKKEAGRSKPLPNNRATKTWQWPFLEGQSTEIQALFERARDETDMADICDIDRLKEVAAGASDIRINVQGKALVASVCVATTLLGEAEPVRDQG